MTVKSITHEGRTYHFGRRAPVTRRPMLQLKHYMPKLVAPPASVDYSPAANWALAQMYENDRLGDCVIAAIAHIDGVMTGNASSPTGGLLFANAEITQLYSSFCGYVPGNSNTDQGCDIQAVMTGWQNNGIVDQSGGVHQIMGILAVDPTNINELQTAIWLFENLIFGVALPDAWVSPMPSASGFVWDVAGNPDPNNGHCFPGLGYDAHQIMISTWAMTGFITYAAVAEYAAASAQGELYVVISQDLINKGTQVAPSGLNWAQLQSDFAALGGVSPTPAPTPVPPPLPPTPVPPAPPTPPPLPPIPTPVGGQPPDPTPLLDFIVQYEVYLANLSMSARLAKAFKR